MSAHSRAPHGNLDNPDTQHEASDINVHAVIWFVGVLSGVVLAINLAMWGMFRVLQHFERTSEPAVTPLARPAGELPAEPRLQTTPWTDLKTFRADQQHYLNGWGWTDEKLGVARIPISKAKEMLLQKGLPVRPELADPSEGTHLAATGESNSGRMIPAGQADRSSVPVAAPAAAPGAPAAPAAPKPPAKVGGGA
jgi:hypothetical protein